MYLLVCCIWDNIGIHSVYKKRKYTEYVLCHIFPSFVQMNLSITVYSQMTLLLLYRCHCWIHVYTILLISRKYWQYYNNYRPAVNRLNSAPVQVQSVIYVVFALQKNVPNAGHSKNPLYKHQKHLARLYWRLLVKRDWTIIISFQKPQNLSHIVSNGFLLFFRNVQM